MRITEPNEHLVMVTQYGIINCFLVREPDGVTLIDALTRGSGRRILSIIERMGQPLRRVLLTHAHSDHIGAVDEILSQSPDTELCVQERAVPILKGDIGLRADEPSGRILRVAYRCLEANIHTTFHDGDRIGSLQAIATPGHTVEHFAFFDSRSGTLIAGDCWQTLGGLAVVGDTRWRFPIPSWGSWHRPTNLESARRTLEFEPRSLAVGHGRVLGDAAPAMVRAVERAALRIS